MFSYPSDKEQSGVYNSVATDRILRAVSVEQDGSLGGDRGHDLSAMSGDFESGWLISQISYKVHYNDILVTLEGSTIGQSQSRYILK